MLRTIKILLLFIPLFAQAQYPSAVETVLKKAGGNRPELEKALKYSTKTGDSLKIKAMQFLIANMDIHSSSGYYWEDANGKKIDYNELNYPDYKQALLSLDSIKAKNPGMKPHPMVYKDIETLTGDYLIQNLEEAFTSWRSSALKTTSFNDFCEYILPYRITVEPVQDWRSAYGKKFKWVNEQIGSVGFKQALIYVKDDYNANFYNTWKEIRSEPLPRLGSLQLLFRKQGPCSDMANLSVFTMRSQGIPATINIIPLWATSTGGHVTSAFFDEKSECLNRDFGVIAFENNLGREPAKVLRLTYSKNPKTLAYFEDANNIPQGFLQQQNYIDVTPEYWETENVTCPLNANPNKPKVVYATSFNGLSWRPFWWGKVENNQTVFTSLCKGTVIVPQYYSDGKLIPAGAPVIVGDKETKVLLPNLNQTSAIIIAEKEKYLKFKLGITYKLFYWNDGWKPLGSQIVNEPITEMKFEKAPKNALLLFLASDSKGLERPFIIDDQNNRTWY